MFIVNHLAYWASRSKWGFILSLDTSMIKFENTPSLFTHWYSTWEGFASYKIKPTKMLNSLESVDGFSSILTNVKLAFRKLTTFVLKIRYDLMIWRGENTFTSLKFNIFFSSVFLGRGESKKGVLGLAAAGL